MVTPVRGQHRVHSLDLPPPGVSGQVDTLGFWTQTLPVLIFPLQKNPGSDGHFGQGQQPPCPLDLPFKKSRSHGDILVRVAWFHPLDLPPPGVSGQVDTLGLVTAQVVLSSPPFKKIPGQVDTLVRGRQGSVP